MATLSLTQIVEDFAIGLINADAKEPQTKTYRAGIGPHNEAEALKLICAELRFGHPGRYDDVGLDVPYPDDPRSKCDLCIGLDGAWAWAVECKMLRLLGDNGKPNDNMLMHILSPYESHRSALTDAIKVSRFSIAERKAVLVWAYHAEEFPTEIAVRAFEGLASAWGISLGNRVSAPFGSLIHPVHRDGEVFAWEIGGV